LEKKLDSSADSFKVILAKNIKLVNNIKSWSLNADMKLIAFKLLDEQDDKRKDEELKKLFANSEADVIVFNALSNRNKEEQQSYEIINVCRENQSAETVDDLAEELYNKWRSK
ncbi:MAG: hypothetical protein KAI45_12315, partial [Melioribacteraceae bacterium]|nr:hypothetical protein [Melioribacteraceae bacterium]